MKSLNTSEARKADLLEKQQKITSLAQCPYCLQPVTADHKHTITSRDAPQLVELETSLNQHKQLLTQQDQKILREKEAVVQLQQQVASLSVFKLQQKQLQEHQQLHARLLAEQQALVAEQITMQQKLAELEKRLALFVSVEEKYLAAQKSYDGHQLAERSFMIEYTRLQKDVESHTKMIALLD